MSIKENVTLFYTALTEQEMRTRNVYHHYKNTANFPDDESHMKAKE